MDGMPEGTGPAGSVRRVPRIALLPGLLFAAYLLFRLGQGVMWLVHMV